MSEAMNKPRFESYLDDGRQRYNLIIPFGSPKKYHWWDGGQGVLDTAAELVLNEMVERKIRRNKASNIVTRARNHRRIKNARGC